MATEIVALLIAAEMAQQVGLSEAAVYLRDLADEWNQRVDTLLYRRGGVLAEHVGVEGYYVRARTPGKPFPLLDLERLPSTELSPDALALVRFGLRSPNDPRMVSTVRVVDAILKTDFAAGPCWRRYPGDKYGEYADGSPFDGHGVGRPWPLFTGERAHFEIAAGHFERADSLRRTMESFANASGMLSEQIWDANDIPSRALVRGSPTGSAAPLGWAHAEYVKLCRSLTDGAVFDLPRHARDRFVRDSKSSRIRSWRVGERTEAIPLGHVLRVVTAGGGTIEWTNDGWTTSHSVRITDTEIGVWFADIPPQSGPLLRVRVRLEKAGAERNREDEGVFEAGD